MRYLEPSPLRRKPPLVGTVRSLADRKRATTSEGVASTQRLESMRSTGRPEALGPLDDSDLTLRLASSAALGAPEWIRARVRRLPPTGVSVALFRRVLAVAGVPGWKSRP